MGDGFHQGLDGLPSLEHLLLKLVSQTVDLLAFGRGILLEFGADAAELALLIPEIGGRVPDLFSQGCESAFEFGAKPAEPLFFLQEFRR